MSPRIVSEPRAAAASHHAQLHRRQVLRLVDDHVPERARRLGEQRPRLVDERHVVLAPARSPTRGRRSSRCSAASRIPSAASARRAWRGEERADETVRRDGGPDPVEPAREEALGVERALDLAEVAPGEAAEPRAVVLVEAAQDVHAEALARMRRQPELLAGLARAARDTSRSRTRTYSPSIRATSSSGRGGRARSRSARGCTSASRTSPFSRSTSGASTTRRARSRRPARRRPAARRSPRRASAARARRTP